METVCKGVLKLLDAGENVELHIMGGGPDLDRLKQYACDDIKFYGYIPYAEMMSVAKGCDIAINAIQSYSMASITNKLSDYMALQKPILNSQVNDEVAEVLTLLPHANYRSRRCGRFRSSRQRYFEAQKRSCSVRRNRPPFQARRLPIKKIVNLIED